MENNDWWTLGVVSMVCSRSLVPFSACLGNLTWPALRKGSELFLGVVLVTLAAALENWPRPLKLHESSSLWAQTWNLISADDCTVGSGGSQQLRGAALWEQHFKTRADSLAWLEMWSSGHIVFSWLFLPFWFCSSFHHQSSCSALCFDEKKGFTHCTLMHDLSLTGHVCTEGQNSIRSLVCRESDPHHVFYLISAQALLFTAAAYRCRDWLII